MNKLFFFGVILLAHVYAFAQNDSIITVHEWGTFTSLTTSGGKQLSGLNRDEEALPSFVYNLDMRIATDSQAKIIAPKNCALKNVTVKMETPVLYFYSPKEMDVKVKVGFKGGLISQWYPQRSGGSEGITKCAEPIDFTGGAQEGFIEWAGHLQKPGIAEKYTEPALNSPVWMSPRATKSNLITTKDTLAQTEKYLFYRGIGNFEAQMKTYFNEHGLFAITNNNSSDEVLYAMVYHKPINGSAEIWWAGSMGKGVMVTMYPKAVQGLTVERVKTNFKNALVAAGLYKDEAEAMLKTWQHSYFDVPGLKVFWIVPRRVTDAILPLQIAPLPLNTQRVLVGRSEVLTPNFEEFIYQVYQNASEDVFLGDRYIEAYRECYELQKTKTRVEDKATEKLYVYPNYHNSKVHVIAKVAAPEGDSVQVEMQTATGTSVMSQAVAVNKKGYFYHPFEYTGQPAGEYVVKIRYKDGLLTEKVLIK